jgi:hypothetical protein
MLAVMTVSTAPVPPVPFDTRVRYIKLGRGGGWEKDCLQKGIIRWGFDSGRADRFSWCINEQWGELMKSFEDELKNNRIATNYTNQTRRFFQDDGSTLWITFVGHTLYLGSSGQIHTARTA